MSYLVTHRCPACGLQFATADDYAYFCGHCLPGCVVMDVVSADGGPLRVVMHG